MTMHDLTPVLIYTDIGIEFTDNFYTATWLAR